MIEKMYEKLSAEIKEFSSFLKLYRSIGDYPVSRLPLRDKFFSFSNRVRTISETMSYFGVIQEGLLYEPTIGRISHSLTRLKEVPVSKVEGSVLRWNEQKQTIEYVPYYNLELTIGTSFLATEELSDLSDDGFLFATTSSFETTNFDDVFKNRVYEHTGGEIDSTALETYTHIYLATEGEHVIFLHEEPTGKTLYIIRTNTASSWVEFKGMSEAEYGPGDALFFTLTYSTGNSNYLDNTLQTEPGWFFEGQ